MEEWQTLPFSPEHGTILCTLAEIPEQGAKEIVFGEGYDSFRVLLLRTGTEIRAYRNCCPHFRVPLNYEPGIFHILDGKVLICAHHGAMYRIADGVCFDGPCEGASLLRIPVATIDGRVVLI